MKDGLLFANAVAKAKENNLFTEERLFRMIDKSNIIDAVKILLEANYGAGLVPDELSDYEKILDAERTLLSEFVTSIDMEDVGFECFFLHADYFNAKSILKAHYGGDCTFTPMKGGLVPFEKLKELITNGSSINPHLDMAIEKIKIEFEEVRSPRFLDTEIDKAMFCDIWERTQRRGSDQLIRNYFRAYADLLNIASFVRTSRISASVEMFNRLIVVGALEPSFFIEIYPDVSALAQGLADSSYRQFAEKIRELDVVSFDVERDNYLLNIIKENRNDMFSIAPSLGFFLAKRNEIRTISMVLVCIKNNVDSNEIKKRLRLLYA
ncbi:MAG: V-type ATPase subunit [Christensenellaceae bacterium]|jgi:V/A-type H+-transporting ATPase subunit C|nr:V-type ATPase subunit [Christensenellaceae bacterium]